MKFGLSLLVALTLIACGKEQAQKEQVPQNAWSKDDKALFVETCQDQISTHLRNSANAPGICSCWVDGLALKYTPEQIDSDDAALVKESNAIFKGCADKAGERLQVARGAIRFPSSEKKPLPKVLQKTLDNVKAKNPPASHGAPAAAAEATRPEAPAAPVVDAPKLGADFSMKGYRFSADGSYQPSGDDRLSSFGSDELKCETLIGFSQQHGKEIKVLVVRAKNKNGDTFTLSIQPFEPSTGFYAHKGAPSKTEDGLQTVQAGFGALVLTNGGSPEDTKASYCEMKDLSLKDGIFKAKLKAQKMSNVDMQASSRDQLSYGDVDGNISCKVDEVYTSGPPAKPVEKAEPPAKVEPPPAPVKKGPDGLFRAAELSLKSIESLEGVLQLNDLELQSSGSLSMTRDELKKIKADAEEEGRKTFKDLQDSSTDQADKDALQKKITDAVGRIQQKVLSQYLSAKKSAR